MSGFYYVYVDGKTYQTRGRGNFRNRGITPLVGDEVVFEAETYEEGYVLEVLPRKNQLVRPPVANVDQGVVVASLLEPDFSYNLMDRFLVTLEYNQITPIIYLSKTDMMAEDDLVEAIRRTYESIGYPVLIPEDDGIQQLEKFFPEHLTVFMGQSGAGKSTLLNKISPELELATGEISAALGRGRHTTRHVELLPLHGGLVADTPGFSSIDFLEMTEQELPKLFPEFLKASEHCKFRECRHRQEPGCEVKHQVETGEIPASRYENYLQFVSEIENKRPVYKKKK